MADLIGKLSAEASLDPVPAVAAATAISGRRAPVKTGIILNTGNGFHRYEDEFFRARNSFIGSAGLFITLPVGRIISLQPEVLYDLNGSRIGGGNFLRHSITIPLNLQLGTPSADLDIRIYYFAGPYFRYNLAGTNAGNSIDFSQVNQQEWGYSNGIALDVFGYTFGFTHRRAITLLFSNGDTRVFDTNSYFTLKYRF